MRLSPGSRLGPYEVVSALATAGPHQVYLARDTRVDRRVTIAALDLPVSWSADERRRALGQSRAVARMGHPGIAAILDVVEDGDTCYLVTEHVQGRTLRAQLADGPLAVGRAIGLAQDLCRALGAAHAHGFVHGDVKPDNVCITAEGRLKVLDLGVAQLTAPASRLDATRSGEPGGAERFSGSPHHAAPERFLGRPADHASDVYAAAAVVFEALTGRPPWLGRDASEVARQALREEPPRADALRRAVPAAVADALATALARDARRRPDSAEALARLLVDAYESARTGPTTHAGTPPVATDGARPAAAPSPASGPPVAAPPQAPAAVASPVVPASVRPPAPPPVHASPEQAPATPVLRVTTEDGRTLRFAGPFRIGRSPDCDVCIDNAHISREHVSVSLENGQWTLRDLQSANGVFVDGQRVATLRVDRRMTIGLGTGGPWLTAEVETTARQARRPGGETIVARVAKGMLDVPDDEAPVGRRTRMVMEAFHGFQQKQRRRYRWMVAAVALVAACAGGDASSLRYLIGEQVALVEQMFYRMKTIDVQIATLERSIAATDTRIQAQLKQYLDQRRQMQDDYEAFLARHNVSGSKVPERDRLILKVTRMFGECDLAAPPGYVAEVTRYIREWERTGRFVRDVRLAQEKGYIPIIVKAFQEQGLPPQYFYLAMQESNFDPFASGPPTRWGIAKGMWQFIPETGERFGLKIGPLKAYQRPDAADERHDWQKATRAAAAYIKDIYSTDAQASGLLVMASYNWGERRVIDLLRTMPADPRERNFWKLLERYRERVAKETYDYVFRIIAATVIGENPRLFDFDLDNPLAAATAPPPPLPPSAKPAN